uniref:Uncharacterized protein n=1 Tax=Arundo donax TaxID=35708 RepID=A0A0A9BN10_ARUDO
MFDVIIIRVFLLRWWQENMPRKLHTFLFGCLCFLVWKIGYMYLSISKGGSY